MLHKLSALVLLSALCAFAQAPEQPAASAPKSQIPSPAPQDAAGKPRDGATKSSGSAAPDQRQLETKLEAYLRNLFAWGPAFELKLGPFADAMIPGFYQVPVQVIYKGEPDTGVVYFSKDGKYVIRGELHDIAADPFAENRANLHIDGNPSKGPADAPVTVVAFSDFECPHCRDLYRTIKEIEPRYPQVRFVFKDFPLTQIHPWAMTAALAARCAYLHDPASFWKVHDAIFENQDLISADNAWDKLQGFVLQAGVPSDSFRACMSASETKQAIDTNIADARSLKTASTPTVFVNGRPLVGGARDPLQQFIDYELHAHHGFNPQP